MQRDPVYPLYQDGRHYDRAFFGQPPSPAAHLELDLYRTLARRAGSSVLELACGTGHFALALARSGLEVTGIDLSAPMLEEARRKAKAANLSVEWVEGDIRTFDLGRPFGLLFLRNNALCHLLHRRDFESCMACVRRHLLPEGRFVVDVFVPSQELLLDKPGERFPFCEYEDPDGRGRVLVTHSYAYEPHTQIKRLTTHHRIGDAEEVSGPLDMRMYYPQELDALFEYNGLRIEHKYGGFDRSPFGAGSSQQVVVCRLP